MKNPRKTLSSKHVNEDNEERCTPAEVSDISL